MQHVFEALWTPQLVQKYKRWHDGRCIYYGGTRKVVLLDEQGRNVAERFWSGDGAPSEGTTIQIDRYLVELDTLQRVVGQVSVPEVPAAPPKSVRRSRHAALDPPLSDVLQAATMRMKPLGSGRTERHVKRRKADRFGGLPPALFGLPETAPGPNALKSEAPLVAAAPQSPPSEASDAIGQDDTELFVKDDFGPLGEPTAVELGERGLENDGFSEYSECDKRIKLDYSAAPAEQDSDGLYSDTEAEVIGVIDAPRPRRSLFEDMPDQCPTEGPWTKEAYLLFSWHPPSIVKPEPPA